MKGEIQSVGSSNVGGRAWQQQWPGQWPQSYPQPRIYPSIQTYVVSGRAEEDYANEVEVERGEFDAVLRFYRTRGKSRTLVKEITVPVGILDWLAADE